MRGGAFVPLIMLAAAGLLLIAARLTPKAWRDQHWRNTWWVVTDCALWLRYVAWPWIVAGWAKRPKLTVKIRQEIR